MKILCVSDAFADSNHSSINGIFENGMNNIHSCDVVYFSKSNEYYYKGNRLVIPYHHKRKGIIAALSSLVDISSYSHIIVRNYFTVLNQFTSKKNKYSFKLGFWESFPHLYRGLHQAIFLNKSVARKRVQYFINNLLANRVLQKADFFLPITEKYFEVFRPNLKCPRFPLSMGVNFEEIPKNLESKCLDQELKKFVYIGVVDQLRKIDVIVDAFSKISENYLFDIYTASDNESTEKIISLGDPRIKIKTAIPRKELLSTIINYDVGIGLIPEDKLYIVSSPTKTLEYYAVGIPALINSIPDHNLLFNDESAFFSDFKEDSIMEKVKQIIDADNSLLRNMGEKGKAKVLGCRDYSRMAANLAGFLAEL